MSIYAFALKLLMQISVIIPCFNSVSFLGDQLEALAGQSWSGAWEVIVADNGSTDGSQALARSYEGRLPGLRVIDASAERGAGYARNTGVAEAGGRWLAFCDADDVVGEGWLAAVAGAMSRCGFAAGRFDFDRLNPPDKHRYRIQHTDLDRLSFAPYCRHAGAGNMAIHRDWFDSVKGFDTSFLSLQDTDLCIRMHLAGYDLQFVPEMVLHVRRRQSLRQQFRQSFNLARHRRMLVVRYDASARTGLGYVKLLSAQAWQVARMVPGVMVYADRRAYFMDRLGRLAGEAAFLLRR